METTQALHK